MSISGKQLTAKQVGQRAAFAVFLALIILAQQFLLMSYSLPSVVGLIGLAALMIMLFLQPEVATLFVVFALYSNLSVIAMKRGLPESVAAATFLLLGLPLFNYVTIRREKLIGSVPLAFMLVYLAVALLSAVFAQDPRDSITWFNNFAMEGLVLYFLIINTVRTPAVLRKAIWVLLFTGALMGSISMYQAFTNSYDNDFGGWATVNQAQVDVGQQDFLGNQPISRRVSGPIGEKNFYALILVLLLPLAISRFSAERSTVLRILVLVLTIPILSGTLLTYSRGAGVAAVAMILSMVALGGLRLKHVLGVGAVAAIALMMIVPDYLYRISTVSTVVELASGNPAEAGSSVRGRATENLAAINIFLDHPILGVGPGQTRFFIQAAANDIDYQPLSGTRRAHNLYLEQLSDVGALGLISYLAIVFATMILLWRVARRFRESRPDVFYTMIGLLAAIITYQVNGVFLHLAYVRYYWFLMALAAAAVHIYGSESGSKGEHVAENATVSSYA